MQAGLSAYQQQAVRNKAIGATWQQGHTAAAPVMVPPQVAYAAAAKERRAGKVLAAVAKNATGTRVLPQGRQVDSTQVFSDHRIANMGGPETMAGHVPVEGMSLPQAQLGVPFTQRTPQPGIPFNPLAFSAGRGASATSTGLPNNGLPYEWQGTLGLAGDYAGTVTDPYSGQVYAAYTDAMQEPKVMNDEPVIKLGEPSRMLEALTGTLSFPKPIPQEHMVDWGDIAEGIQFPQGLINNAVEARVAQQAAGETYMVNNETLAGYNDTNWDGYIGDTFVLRPAIDTQTLADNSQTNTVVMNRLQAPQVNAAFQLGEGLGAHVGSYFQPSIRLLAQEKPTAPGRPKRDFEPNGYWSMPAANTAGYSHKILDAINSRAGEPLFSLNLGMSLPTASDGNPVDRTQVVTKGTGASLNLGGMSLPTASDGNPVDRTQVVTTGQALALSTSAAPAFALASDNLPSDAALYTAASQTAALGNSGGHMVASTDSQQRDAGVAVSGAPGSTFTRAPQSRMPFVLPYSGDAWVATTATSAGAPTAPLPHALPAVAEAFTPDAAMQTFQAQRQTVDSAGAPMPITLQGINTDAGLVTHQTQQSAVMQAGDTRLPMSAIGKQGVEHVLRALAGSGAYGPTTDAPMATASEGWGADAAVQAGLASITAGVPQDIRAPMAVDTRNRAVDASIQQGHRAVEIPGGFLPTMPAGRDGTLAWDALLRRLAVPAEYDMSPAALPAAADDMAAARTQPFTLRVSNDATLFATGQSLGADQNIPTYASAGGTNKDASQFGAWRQAREQQLYEHNARAHPSTYGAGAEFRNVYTGPARDRQGLVSMNPDTARLMASPARLVMEAAAAEQLRKRDAANAAKDPSMYASAVAYESDYANSGPE